jgi:hypothetical protein
VFVWVQGGLTAPADIAVDPFVIAVQQELAKPAVAGEPSPLGHLEHTQINSEEDALGILAELSAVRGGERQMRLVLAGVSSHMDQVRHAAIRELLDPRVRGRVQSYSEDLIPELADYAENENSAELLGLLDMPESLQADILKSTTVPNRVKARLGDEEAEARLISRFHAARPFNRMTYAERDLLYIDSRRTLVALVEELNSRDVDLDRFGNQVSVTQMMIQAYGHSHPDVALFQPEAYLPHCYTTEEEFQAPEHQAYLRLVGDYFAGILGQPVEVDVPFLIMGSASIEIHTVD